MARALLAGLVTRDLRACMRLQIDTTTSFVKLVDHDTQPRSRCGSIAIPSLFPQFHSYNDQKWLVTTFLALPPACAHADVLDNSYH